jgi:hypothetical protein
MTAQNDRILQLKPNIRIITPPRHSTGPLPVLQARSPPPPPPPPASRSPDPRGPAPASARCTFRPHSTQTCAATWRQRGRARATRQSAAPGSVKGLRVIYRNWVRKVGGAGSNGRRLGMGEWVLSEFGKKKKKPINQSINSKSINQSNLPNRRSPIPKHRILPTKNLKNTSKTSKIPQKSHQKPPKSIKNHQKSAKNSLSRYLRRAVLEHDDPSSPQNLKNTSKHIQNTSKTSKKTSKKPSKTSKTTKKHPKSTQKAPKITKKHQ